MKKVNNKICCTCLLSLERYSTEVSFRKPCLHQQTYGALHHTALARTVLPAADLMCSEFPADKRLIS